MPNDDTAAMQVRVSGHLREQVENWRRSQLRIPPLSEALRQVSEKALVDERRRKPAAHDCAAA
jgi:hypothetical protein